MQLALECPTSLLEEIQPLADFDWLLTHKVLEDEGYANFYKNSKRWKVLDNSVNELLQPCSLSDMQKAAEVVSLGSIVRIVPPDFLGNSFETISALEEAIKVFGRTGLLPVIQGSDLSDCLRCAQYIKKEGFRGVAVPYDITCRRTDLAETMGEKRQEVIGRIRGLFYWIHLLGMTTIKELESYRTVPEVQSIDTGLPIMCGLKGIKLGEEEVLFKAVPTLDRMQEDLGSGKSGINWALIYRNIAYLRMALGGPLVDAFSR